MGDEIFGRDLVESARRKKGNKKNFAFCGTSKKKELDLTADEEDVRKKIEEKKNNNKTHDSLQDFRRGEKRGF